MKNLEQDGIIPVSMDELVDFTLRQPRCKHPYEFITKGKSQEGLEILACKKCGRQL